MGDRLAPRRRVKQHAAIIPQRGIAIDCTVMDISETGARLTFPSRIILPRKFKLHLATPTREIDVTVIWQKGTLAGVRFATRIPELKVRAPASYISRLLARAAS